MDKKGSVGVFDSGLGGLFILKYLKEELPQYDYVFLGDQANVPYGEKTKDELFAIATKGLDFLYGEMDCMGVVLACNTISSTIYDRLRDWKDKKYFGRILFGIVRPTVKGIGKGDKVAIFATPRTCLSEIYEKFFQENLGTYKKVPMKDLASIIENGGDSYSYISSFKDKIKESVSNGALLCTHYGIVKDEFKKIFPNISNWVYQEELIPKYLKDYFLEFPEREQFFSNNHSINIYVTKESETFNNFKNKWFGEDLKINLINLDK